MVICRVAGSTALTMASTLSLVQPSWVIRKAGDLSSLTTRASEKAASSAVTGLPDVKVRPGRILNTMVLPSGLTVQLSATPPTSLVMSLGSLRIRRS